MAAPAHAPILSGIQKAAILLISVGDQVSAELLKRLGDDEVQAVTAAIASLPAISREQAETVLEEFRASTSHSGQGHGGVDFAKRILTSAFGAEGSKKHVERLPKAAGRSSTPASACKNSTHNFWPDLSKASIRRPSRWFWRI